MVQCCVPFLLGDLDPVWDLDHSYVEGCFKCICQPTSHGLQVPELSGFSLRFPRWLSFGFSRTCFSPCHPHGSQWCHPTLGHTFKTQDFDSSHHVCPPFHQLTHPPIPIYYQFLVLEGRSYFFLNCILPFLPHHSDFKVKHHCFSFYSGQIWMPHYNILSPAVSDSCLAYGHFLA